MFHFCWPRLLDLNIGPVIDFGRMNCFDCINSKQECVTVDRKIELNGYRF